MGRTARKISESGYYHIVMRGINRQVIFHDDQDKQVFLNRLKLCKQEVDYDLIAYCLMSNHIHLLIKEKDTKIGEIFRKVLSSYVMWYNRKYERVGHLFQDRFKSEPIEDDNYMIACARYILQNPVKAKLCDGIFDFNWSSARVLVGEHSNIVNKTILHAILDTNLVPFMSAENDDKFLEWEVSARMSDEKIGNLISDILTADNLTDLMLAPKDKREEVIKILVDKNISYRDISKHTGVPISVIRNVLAANNE